MTREEAIKWFEGEKEAAERQVVAFESYFKCFKSAHRKIVAYNDMAIAALREQPRWISVEESLPTPFVSVLVYMPEERPLPTVHEGYVTRDGKWYAHYFDRNPGEVTHWMPLPEAPKEESRMTNAQKIRSMTDWELAEWMSECNAYGERAIASQWMPWLKQPYKEEP